MSPPTSISPESTPITVVGSVAFDTIETTNGRRDRLLGGSATYFAAAARLCTAVRIVSIVGSDFRAEDQEILLDLGIDLSALERRPGQTYAWHGSYGADFANATTVSREIGVIRDYAPRLDPDGWSGGLFLGAMAPPIQRQVLDSLPTATLTALDSREAWIEEYREELVSLSSRVDFVILNIFELLALTGCDSVDAGIEMLLAGGTNSVIVKRGAAGATLYGQDAAMSVPACPATVVDPTGAGDAFAGGFLGRLASHGRDDAEALGEALRYGAAMAAFALESFGTESLAKLCREELEQRVGTIEWQPHR